MAKLLIETASNRVVNRIADPMPGWAAPAGHHVEADDGRDIWREPVVVESVPAWAAKVILERAGLLAAAEAAAQGAGDEWRWRFHGAPTWHRDNVLTLAPALSLSEAQVDAMLAQAAALVG